MTIAMKRGMEPIDFGRNERVFGFVPLHMNKTTVWWSYSKC